jgi:hypothetical protein
VKLSILLPLLPCGAYGFCAMICLLGEKMVKYTLCFGSGGGDDQTMENTMYRGPVCSSSPVLKAFGSSKRGIV